jgi:hypothetical protein
MKGAPLALERNAASPSTGPNEAALCVKRAHYFANAKGVASTLRARGNAPGYDQINDPVALKARFDKSAARKNLAASE